MKFLCLSNLTAYDIERDKDIQVNVGCYYQLIMAMEHLFEYMGIDEKDIVRMEYKDVPTYKGEKLIFPLNLPISDKREALLKLSDDIIPVFLGLSIHDYNWKITEERIAYLKKYEPIGCRDYNTYQRLKGLGIEAYLSGCISMTMPRRQQQSKDYDTVFFVDAPQSLLHYMPESLKEKMEYREHMLYVTKEELLGNYCVDYTRNLYNLYRDRAKLVITGRFHCAIPCMAMGIPVILAKEYLGYPFDLVPKFLPFYTPDTYADIDWNPQPVEMEEYKGIALACAAKRVNDVYQKYHYYNLHDEFSSLYRDGYVKHEMSLEPFKTELERRYAHLDYFEYALWGISTVADRIYEYMQSTYPNAKLVKVIDLYKEELYKGIPAEKPDVLTRDDNFLTIVTTINCSNHAKLLFKEIEKPSKSYIYTSDPADANL